MTGTQKYLFYGGVACLIVALVLAGIAVVAGTDEGETGPVAESATTSEPSTPSTDATPPETDDEFAPTTTVRVGPPDEDTTTSEPGDTTSDVISGDENPAPNDAIDVPEDLPPEERMAAVAAQVPFPVLSLNREGWVLTALEAGRDGTGNPVVVLIYEQGDEFLNVNERPQGEQPPLGGDVRQVQARGTTVELQEVAALTLARWDEGGASVLVSSTAQGDRLVQLIEALEAVE